jgi:hypothetical protein
MMRPTARKTPKPVSAREIRDVLARDNSPKNATRPEQLSRLRRHFEPRIVTERRFKEAIQADKRGPGRPKKA